MRYRSWLAGASAAALVATGAAASSALASDHGRRHTGVYAPYFETWTKDSVAAVAARSGVRYLTLAFIQAAGKKGAAACTVAWDGAKKQPI